MKDYAFPPARPGPRPRRKAPPPLRCPDGGYIVERIVGRQTEELCFDGRLDLCGLPCGLCPPLTLREAVVIDVRPCPPEPCDPCTNGGARLKLTLLCTVTDARGCMSEATACIDAVSFARVCRPGQGLLLRRGAEVCVVSACFCPPCGFDASLRILLTTIASRSEITPGCGPCRPPCPPPLPLYPPPARRTPAGIRF